MSILIRRPFHLENKFPRIRVQFTSDNIPLNKTKFGIYIIMLTTMVGISLTIRCNYVHSSSNPRITVAKIVVIIL